MTKPASTALITGIAGQDGVLLARRLRATGYRVVGTTHPGTGSAASMACYLQGVDVVAHDIRDTQEFARMLDDVRPSEIYNLAAFSSVGQSWQHAQLVAEINAMAVLRMLDELRSFRDRHGWAPRFYQASTSEMFGSSTTPFQTETTPHHPRSPYAAAKSFAHNLSVNYRESYDLFVSTGILYNHESALRGRGFVTRKITRGAAEIALGRRGTLPLGNLDVSRDWGSAHDYVEAMRLTLACSEPGDYLIATGTAHSLTEFVEAAFAAAGVSDPWSHIEQDAALLRPADVSVLRGDASKANETLGWRPTTGFDTIVSEMVMADIQRVETGVEESLDYLR